MSRSVFTPAYGIFLRRLVQARKAAGKTQMEVASRLGRPQSFVSKYERGERRLDVVELIEVTGVLGADPVAFVRDLVRSMGPVRKRPARRRKPRA